MGGPIGGGDGDWLPRSEQRMPRLQYEAATEARAQQTAPHVEPQQQQYAEYDDFQPPPQAESYEQLDEPRAPQRAQYNGGWLEQGSQPAQPRAVQQGYLAAHAVEKTFGNRKVVKGASLYVRRGEAVGLLGPNGAGKTTIFYMITGLIAADRGRVELDGHDVTTLPMYQRARLGIGYLPQEASIFRGLNVEENIRAVLEVVEPDKRRRERDLDALLEEFNITK